MLASSPSTSCSSSSSRVATISGQIKYRSTYYDGKEARSEREAAYFQITAEQIIGTTLMQLEASF